MGQAKNKLAFADPALAAELASGGLDRQFGAICAILKLKGLTAHTQRAGNTVVAKRRPRRSRLAGEPR